MEEFAEFLIRAQLPPKELPMPVEFSKRYPQLALRGYNWNGRAKELYDAMSARGPEMAFKLYLCAIVLELNKPKCNPAQLKESARLAAMVDKLASEIEEFTYQFPPEDDDARRRMSEALHDAAATGLLEGMK